MTSSHGFIFSIGLETALRLAHEGARIVISSRLQKNIDTAIEYLIASGVKRENVAAAICHQGDVEQRRALVRLALDRFGRIDVLLVNAGINPATGSILAVTEKQWDKIFDVNVRAPLALAQESAPHMAKVG